VQYNRTTPGSVGSLENSRSPSGERRKRIADNRECVHKSASLKEKPVNIQSVSDPLGFAVRIAKRKGFSTFLKRHPEDALQEIRITLWVLGINYESADIFDTYSLVRAIRRNLRKAERLFAPAETAYANIERCADGHQFMKWRNTTARVA
jgi:hypothetical protein